MDELRDEVEDLRERVVDLEAALVQLRGQVLYPSHGPYYHPRITVPPSPPPVPGPTPRQRWELWCKGRETGSENKYGGEK